MSSSVVELPNINRHVPAAADPPPSACAVPPRRIGDAVPLGAASARRPGPGLLSSRTVSPATRAYQRTWSRRARGSFSGVVMSGLPASGRLVSLPRHCAYPRPAGTEYEESSC